MCKSFMGLSRRLIGSQQTREGSTLWQFWDISKMKIEAFDEESTLKRFFSVEYDHCYESCLFEKPPKTK